MRSAISILILCVALSLQTTQLSMAQTNPATTLRQAADRRGLLIGAAVNPDLLRQPDYARTLRQHFNTVVAENVMKFESVQPREGKFDFTAADKLVAFADNMKVRGHTLVWHSQVPQWVTEQRCKDAEAILRTHISAVVGHFKGKVFAWDVVNEALDDDGSLRETFWLRCIGPDYIAKAFRWAHAADPKAKLFYNDYGIESPGRKAERAFELVRDLKAQGVPIDGIGLQMHLDRIPDDIFIAKYMSRFEELGLEVHMTEMDVRLPEPASTRDLLMQAEAYRMAVRRCVQAGNCTAFLTWGVTDRYSWIPDFFPGYGSALLFDKDYRPKPAFRAVLSELNN